MHVNPGDTRDLNPVVKGSIYRATHKASVIGILGGDAPKVVSKGRRFYNRDRWTLRFLVDVMCEWAKKNPGCVPSHADVTEWVRIVNAKVVSANEKEIVIANTPDVLPLRVAMALVGGAYHEALHTKYSCRRNLQPYEIIDIVVGRWARVKDWSVYVKALLEWSNIVEDIRIERRGREEYEGINVKMHDLQDFILFQEEKSQENRRAHGGRPGALSVIMGAFRDYGLGYNTDRQQNALARYVRDNPLAVELVLEGPLAPLLDEAINLKREDDTGSLRVAMDVIATLAELSNRDKEDEQNNKENQPGDGKTQCPNCGAPGNKLKVRPKSNGKGSRVKGKGIVTCTVCNWQDEIDVQTKKDEDPKPKAETENKDTPDFEGFDDLDPADKPKESKDPADKPKESEDPKGKPSKNDPADEEGGEEDEKDAPGQASTEDPKEDEDGEGGDEEANAGPKDEDTDKGAGSGGADDDSGEESESPEDVKGSKGESSQAEGSADDEETDQEGSGGAGEDNESDEGGDDEGEGAEGQGGGKEESDGEGSASGGGSDEDDGEEGQDGDEGLGDGLDDSGLTDEDGGEEDEDGGGGDEGGGNRSPDASDDSEEIDEDATGEGAGGHKNTNKPVENDWSDLANDAMEQAEAGDDLGLQDAGSALEEAINSHLDKEDEVQAGEAPWRPFDVSKDKVTVVPPSLKGIDKDKEDADLIIKSVKLETAYLRSRMRTMVRSIEMTGTARGVLKGRALSSRYLVDTVSTLRAGERPRRAFDHRGEAVDMTMACAVVLDQSGSMTGLRKDATRIMVAITEPLDALNCPTLAIGFRDGDDAKFGYRGYHNTAEDDGQYHRNHGVNYDIFKGFNEKFRTVRWRFANTRADGGTPMSDGVQFALNALSYRKEAHRFLFVVTDGYPNYGHPPVMNYQIRLAKEAGIFVIGVGIGKEAEYVKTTFPLSVWSERVAEFPKLLLAKMNELVDMQATKRGRIVKDTSR